MVFLGHSCLGQGLVKNVSIQSRTQITAGPKVVVRVLEEELASVWNKGLLGQETLDAVWKD